MTTTETTETTTTTTSEKTPKAEKAPKAEKPAKTEKAPKPEAPKTEKTPKVESKGGSTDAADLQGYAKIFEPWEPIPCDTGIREVHPKRLAHIFDVRATPEPLTEHFLASTKDGITSPPCITQMRYVGPSTSEYKKGETYDVVVFGRMRLRAAERHGFTRVVVTVRAYKTWMDMVTSAWEENAERHAQTTWDTAVMCRNFRDGGQTAGQIAERLHVKESFVTQHLSIHDLADGAKTAIRQGRYGITVVRALRGIPEAQQESFMAKAIEQGWNAEQLVEKIKTFRAQNPEAKSEKGRKPRARVARVSDYGDAPLKARPVKEARLLLTYFATKGKQLRTDEGDPAKVKYLEGVRAGMEFAYGLKEPPKAALVEPEEDDEEGEAE